jgi:capsular polysaccharide transport system ATP-binding protein
MIVVEDVHKRYQTPHGPGRWVLKGVSFTIPRQLNVGLIGGNGAGKSLVGSTSPTPDASDGTAMCRGRWASPAGCRCR